MAERDCSPRISLEFKFPSVAVFSSANWLMVAKVSIDLLWQLMVSGLEEINGGVFSYGRCR